VAFRSPKLLKKTTRIPCCQLEKISHLATPCNLQKPVPAAPIPMGFGVVKSMLDDAGVHLHFTGVPMNCLGSTIDKH